MSQQAFAMIFDKVEAPFSARNIPFPNLKEDELLVENEYATICTSDLHSFYGRRPACCNSILGHEIVGKIMAISAAGAKDYYGNPLKEGDRITWSIFAYDPASPTAKKGFPQKSEGLYKYGHSSINESHQLNGGFASHTHLKKGTVKFRLSGQLNGKEAAPINCTHATIAGAIRLAGAVNGKNVLVSGVGMLGLSACAMARENGANAVIGLDVNAKKSKNALNFGAERYYSNATDIPVDEIGGIDIIIETSGVPEAMERAIPILSIGGTLVLVGAVFPQRDLKINAEYIVRHLLSIKGLHNYVPQDLANAIRFIESTKSKYRFSKLIGKEFPLDALNEAFESGNSGEHYRVGVRMANTYN